MFREDVCDCVCRWCLRGWKRVVAKVLMICCWSWGMKAGWRYVDDVQMVNSDLTEWVQNLEWLLFSHDHLIAHMPFPIDVSYHVRPMCYQEVLVLTEDFVTSSLRSSVLPKICIPAFLVARCKLYRVFVIVSVCNIVACVWQASDVVWQDVDYVCLCDSRWFGYRKPCITYGLR